MTVRSAWLLNRDVATPAQSRSDTRLSPLGTMTPSSADALTSIGGLIPGGPATGPCNLTMSGMGWTISIGRGIAQGTSAQGAYPIVVTAGDTGTIANGHASLARIDTLWLIALDTLVDGSGSTLARIEYTQGTPGSGSAPTAPAAGTAYLRLWDIQVPAGASAGAPPNWVGAGLLTDRRTYTVAAGGIGYGANGNGAYPGQYRDNGGLQRWDGSSWLDRLLLNSAGRVVVGGDTEWYRDAANRWRTPDSLVVDGDLTVSGVGQARTASRTADSSPLSSNTTLTNDTQLLLSVAANAKYRLSGLLGMLGPTAADMKLKFTAPASATLNWVAYSQDTALSGPTGAIQTARMTLADTAACGTITGSTPVGALLSGILTTGGTAGTLQLQWAQNTSTAGNTIMAIDSFIELLRIS